MIKFLKVALILFLLILLPKIANSLTSSSYLIVNFAISSFDYETASKYFTNHDYADFSITELREKIVSFVNSNKLEEANSIAKQIIKNFMIINLPKLEKCNYSFRSEMIQ